MHWYLFFPPGFVLPLPFVLACKLYDAHFHRYKCCRKVARAAAHMFPDPRRPKKPVKRSRRRCNA